MQQVFYFAFKKFESFRPKHFAEFLLETRLESESFEPLIDFLAFLG